MPTGKNLYFASDIHLGAGGHASSRQREDRFIRWLDMIKDDVAELFLMGDVFDFWFEYKTVVPKGYVRFLGKLAQLTDAGVKLYLFKGNHDMWMFEYFVTELNATIISNELVIERNGKKFYLHHGDGLGPGDNKYKFLKKIFRSKLCQWLFARLHPNFGIGIANAWSHNSKLVNAKIGEEKLHPREWIEIYSNEVLQTRYFDYMVYGHRHKPMDIQLTGKSRYVNLGDWVSYFTMPFLTGYAGAEVF
jgi:UDP-2,3-diacylglucosamine hydrolase